MYIAGTELHEKSLVTSRTSKLKNLLALTKIEWPSIMHTNAFVDVICLPEQSNFCEIKQAYLCIFTSKTSLKHALG